MAGVARTRHLEVRHSVAYQQLVASFHLLLFTSIALACGKPLVETIHLIRLAARVLGFTA
jgi:hypothetical protein